MEKIQERYFVFTENNGFIEGVVWCKTLTNAKNLAKARKMKFPQEADHVYICEILTEN